MQLSVSSLLTTVLLLTPILALPNAVAKEEENHKHEATKVHSRKKPVPTCDAVATCGDPIICPPQDKVVCLEGEHKCKIKTTCTFLVICGDFATPCGADNVSEICVSKTIKCKDLAGFV